MTNEVHAVHSDACGVHDNDTNRPQLVYFRLRVSQYENIGLHRHHAACLPTVSIASCPVCMSSRLRWKVVHVMVRVTCWLFKTYEVRQ